MKQLPVLDYSRFAVRPDGNVFIPLAGTSSGYMFDYKLIRQMYWAAVRTRLENYFLSFMAWY